MYDVVLNNGLIVDGSGRPSYLGNVGIKDDKIVEITDETIDGKITLDIRGKILAPGFIDVHSHGDLLPILDNKYRLSRVKQGITSEIVGQCGISPWPVKDNDFREYIKPIVGDTVKYESLDVYLKDIKGKMPHNMAFLVGISALRYSVAGFSDEKLSLKQLEEMIENYERELENGALGLSLGLSYLPGVFARKEELIALAEVTKSYEGFIMAHIRSHGKDMIKAIEELVDICRGVGVRLHISHYRSYGNKDFGVTAKDILDVLEKYRAEGLLLTVDQHPYLNGSTFLNQLIPPKYRDISIIKDMSMRAEIEGKIMDKNYRVEGWDNFSLMVGFDNILIPKYKGTLVEIGEKRGKSPFDTLMDILIEENGNTVMVVKNMFIEEDIIDLLQDNFTLIGSDGLPSGTHPHPRLYGTFPKIISCYVNDKKVLTLENAVREMTGGDFLRDRGLIEKGYKADLVVFTLNEFSHEENYIDDNKDPKGLDIVIINGKISYDKGVINDNNGVAILREDNIYGYR